MINEQPLSQPSQSPPPAQPELQASSMQTPTTPVKSKNGLVLLLAIITLLSLGIAGFFGYKYWQSQLRPITSYEECVKANGNQITAMFPGTCTTRDGRQFTQPLTEEEKKKLEPPADPTANWKTYSNANANLFLKYPSEMSEMFATEGGVSGPILGNVNLVVSFADKSTVRSGTDAPFDGFSVDEIEVAKLGMSFDSYINKEVEAVKSHPRGMSTATAVKTSIGNQNFTYIDSETTIRRYFILSPDNKRIAIFSRVNSTAEFLNTFDQILSTFKFLEKPSRVSATPLQTNGVELKDIKYSLPLGWESKLSTGGLSLSPIKGGGYLSVKMYDYSGTTGRREYYCQVSKVCIEGTSYFTEMNIGNISGYVANALDNSGGGIEYFGAKGNKFYIISSYNPPSPNDFEQNYKKVLSSLVF